MTDDSAAYNRFQDDTPTPLVLDRGLVRKWLFEEPENAPFDVLFLVSSNYAEDPEYERYVADKRVRYFKIKEPYPNLVLSSLALKEMMDLPEGVRIAIACTAGVNRSATFASVLHAHRTGKTFCEALADVRRHRTQAAPFWSMAAAVCLAYKGLTGRDLGPVEPCVGQPTDFENNLNTWGFTHEDFKPPRYEETMKKWQAMADKQTEKVKRACEGGCE